MRHFMVTKFFYLPAGVDQNNGFSYKLIALYMKRRNGRVEIGYEKSSPHDDDDDNDDDVMIEK